MTGRKLLDWAPLVSELADFLNLERFRVLGISGGAPYAYALAWAMPERVRVVAVVSGAPNIAELSDHSGLLALYRWLMFADQEIPGSSLSLRISTGAAASFIAASAAQSLLALEISSTMRCRFVA